MSGHSKVRLEIVICVMPWELRHFERQLLVFQDTLKEVDPSCIRFDVSLVTSPNIISWKDSKLQQNDIEDQFQRLCSTSSLPGRFVIERGPQILGCVDKRRDHLQRCSPSSMVCWLDPDIHFPPWILSTLLELLPKVPEPFFILSPQVPKLWDETWDPLVHRKFRSKDYGFCFQYDPGRDSIFRYQEKQKISLVPLSTTKFAGGWFSIFPAKLLKSIGIPKSFPPYGLEDTYLMQVIHHLNRFGFGAKQYVLEGLFVAETYIDEETNLLRGQCELVEPTNAQAQRARKILKMEKVKTILRLLPRCIRHRWLREKELRKQQECG